MKIALLLFTAFAAISCSKAPESTAIAESSQKETDQQIEYATNVPGKPGFVQSPYAPEKGYIDVRGYTKDTEAKDPYSGKMFLVPDINTPPPENVPTGLIPAND